MKSNKYLSALLIFPILLHMIVPSTSQEEYIVEQINENVTVTQTGEGRYTLTMNENNHDYNDKTPLVSIANAEIPPYTMFIGADTFNVYFEVENMETRKIILYANQSFDYETQPNDYILLVDAYDTVGAASYIMFTLKINNIDDEPPAMDCPRCSMYNHVVYSKENSTCFCTVSDDDGFLNLMTFDIVDGAHDESSLFELDFVEEPQSDTKIAVVSIFPINILQGESIPNYDFSVQAKDSASHPTTPENTEIIIDVNN